MFAEIFEERIVDVKTVDVNKDLKGGDVLIRHVITAPRIEVKIVNVDDADGK